MEKRPDGVTSARAILVIQTKTRKGLGTEKDPVREVTQYWDLSGKFLAEMDPEMLIPQIIHEASAIKISIQQEMHPEKNRVEVVAITTEEGKHLLLIGNETIEILNYTAKSSSDGATELFVTIKGIFVSTELSANLEE